MRLLARILNIGFLFTSLASNAGDTAPAGYGDLVQMVQQARQQGVPAGMRADILNNAIDQYKKLEMSYRKWDEPTLLKNLQNPTEHAKLQSPSDPYRDLYSEINFLAGTMMSDGKFDKCFTGIDRWMLNDELTQNVLQQRSQYCAETQGTGYSGLLGVAAFSRLDPKTKQDVYKSYPLLFGGKNLTNILYTADQIVTDKDLSKDSSYLGQNFPSYDKRANPALSRNDYLDIKNTERLKDSIYDAAITNSLSTEAAIDYFWGGKSLDSVKNSLTVKAKEKCKACSDKRIQADVNKALNTVLSQKKNYPKLSKQYNDPRNVAVDLCNNLIDKGYYKYYYGGQKVNFDPASGKFTTDLKEKQHLAYVDPSTLPDVVVTTSVNKKRQPAKLDLTKMLKTLKDAPAVDEYGNVNSSKLITTSQGGGDDGALAAEQFRKSRLEIYQQAVKDGSANLLFVTDALSSRQDDEKGTTYYPKLSCDQNSIDSDGDLIKKAIEDAKGQADKVMDDLNTAITPSNLKDPKAAIASRKQIQDMLDKNPTAVGQALATDPDLSYLVCESLHNHISDDLTKKQIENTSVWGVRIVGGVLMATGVGAPAGTALLLASAGMTAISSVDLADDYLKSNDAKELSQMYETQYRGGQSGNARMSELSEEKVREYQQLKVTTMSVVGVGVSAVPFIGEGIKYFKSMEAFEGVINAAKGSKYFNKLLSEKPAMQALEEFASTDATAIQAQQNALALGKETTQLTSAATKATEFKYAGKVTADELNVSRNYFNFRQQAAALPEGTAKTALLTKAEGWDAVVSKYEIKLGRSLTQSELDELKVFGKRAHFGGEGGTLRLPDGTIDKGKAQGLQDLKNYIKTKLESKGYPSQIAKKDAFDIVDAGANKNVLVFGNGASSSAPALTAENMSSFVARDANALKSIASSSKMSEPQFVEYLQNELKSFSDEAANIQKTLGSMPSNKAKLIQEQIDAQFTAYRNLLRNRMADTGTGEKFVDDLMKSKGFRPASKANTYKFTASTEPLTPVNTVPITAAPVAEHADDALKTLRQIQQEYKDANRAESLVNRDQRLYTSRPSTSLRNDVIKIIEDQKKDLQKLQEMRDAYKGNFKASSQYMTDHPNDALFIKNADSIADVQEKVLQESVKKLEHTLSGVNENIKGSVQKIENLNSNNFTQYKLDQIAQDAGTTQSQKEFLYSKVQNEYKDFLRMRNNFTDTEIPGLNGKPVTEYMQRLEKFLNKVGAQVPVSK